MGTLICRIELNKTDGITIKVENAESSITQTIVMDGTSITTTCAGSSDTSTITQKADSIVIKCKDFEVDATTITCKSSGATKHESGDKFDISSMQNMTLDSTSDIVAKATQNVKISSTLASEINATTSITLTGKVQAELSGATATVEGKGMLTAKSSGITSVEGSVTNIKGSLVKIGS